MRILPERESFVRFWRRSDWQKTVPDAVCSAPDNANQLHQGRTPVNDNNGQPLAKKMSCIYCSLKCQMFICFTKFHKSFSPSFIIKQNPSSNRALANLTLELNQAAKRNGFILLSKAGGTETYGRLLFRRTNLMCPGTSQSLSLFETYNSALSCHPLSKFLQVSNHL